MYLLTISLPIYLSKDLLQEIGFQHWDLARSAYWKPRAQGIVHRQNFFFLREKTY
jgi:hypothetical protein